MVIIITTGNRHQSHTFAVEWAFSLHGWCSMVRFWQSREPMVFLIGRRGMQGQLESSSEIGTMAPCSL